MKFNSQIATSREQSQKLLSLGLKPETADMYIDQYGFPVAFPFGRLKGHRDEKSIAPAWSLSRLLDLLPPYITEGGFEHQLRVINPVVGYYNPFTGENICYFNRTDIFENFIDAISFLIRNNQFDKEYLKGDIL